MARYEFVSTHGYNFGEDSGDGFKVWARFTNEPGLATPNGEKRYSFATDDAAVAKRLRGVAGVTEVSAPEPEPKGRKPKSEG